MKNIGIVLAGIFVLTCAVFTGYQWGLPKDNGFVGSVSRSSEYNATSTGCGSAATAGTYTITSSTIGSLNNITIVSSSTGVATGLTFYNADGDATTTILVMKEGMAAGTYVLDMILSRGLRMTIPSGFNGCVVTSYR